jgi:hypothetical protein
LVELVAKTDQVGQFVFIGVGYPAAGCADHSPEHFQPFGSFNLSHVNRLILENSVN